MLNENDNEKNGKRNDGFVKSALFKKLVVSLIQMTKDEYNRLQQMNITETKDEYDRWLNMNITGYQRWI